MSISKWLDTGNLYVNFTFILQYNFFSLYVLLFIYFWNYFDCGTLEGLDTFIYIIFGIFISVKILSLNLFGMELIFHLKLGDLCEKSYLHFFFFLSIYFSIKVVQLLLKLYDLKKKLDNAIHLDYWYYFFDLVFLINYTDYFLTYSNIKMAMTSNL